MTAHTDTDRRNNTHDARMQYLTKRVDWINQYGHPYPDRRQHPNEIRPERKIDKNTTVA